ncbi:MAG: hypothetical protein A2309_01795 [Bacteroidetes bacterium RIFOXYB2_FULL_35_7]|nr:MAG: hypothetical protein A2309_01795 [Bacteroidetes bacterium RIFOXYB2_FULL_35_7]
MNKFFLIYIIIIYSPLCVFSQNSDTTNSKNKTLEEIYREARASEGEIIVPPQINPDYYKKISAYFSENKIDILILEFKKYRDLAKKNSGSFVSGNLILGAPSDPYFSPSENAKRASFLGSSIEKYIAEIKDTATFSKIILKLLGNKIIYSEMQYVFYTFEMIDVVGSGRFTYPGKGIEIKKNLVLLLLEKSMELYPQKNFILLRSDAEKYKGKHFLEFLKILHKTIRT